MGNTNLLCSLETSSTEFQWPSSCVSAYLAWLGKYNVIFCAVQSHVPLFGVSGPQWCPLALFEHVHLSFRLNCWEVVAGLMLHQYPHPESPKSSIHLHRGSLVT